MEFGTSGICQPFHQILEMSNCRVFGVIPWLTLMPVKPYSGLTFHFCARITGLCRS
ncbi:MAG: hypothetical protein WKI04_04880 [Ferruginibacter sp.]